MTIEIQKGFVNTIKIVIKIKDNGQHFYDLTGKTIVLLISSEFGEKIKEIRKNEYNGNDKPSEGLAFIHILPEDQPPVGTYIFSLILEQENGNKMLINRGVLVVK